MSLNRLYVASILKIFSNVFRHRVKLLACGLLVMLSLLCYILKSHESSFTNTSRVNNVNNLNNIEIEHIIRHHHILKQQQQQQQLQLNKKLDKSGDNIHIISNDKRKKSLFQAKTIDKSDLEIIDFYKQIELKNNKKSSVINNNNNNNVNNQNNLVNTQPVYVADNFSVEDSLKNLEKIIHIDLKGAPPKIDFFRSFIPMLSEYGATGILLEYEDTFPYEGELAEAKHGHAYTISDVELIKKLAKENNLYIIPLVQTYGHLEWMLKLSKFAHLRDNADFPQVITQCLNESYTVLYDMIDQVIKLHPDAPYFHIGCDEVYYKLMHPNCSNLLFKDDFTEAFMNHLIKIASHVKKRIKNTKVLFWNDMLNGMEESSLKKFKPAILALDLEPMIWAYAENIKDYFQPEMYTKYSKIFSQVWAASAYKGASGELTTVTSIEHHYLNHLSWIELILEKQKLSVLKFRGIALTGWSRYDHFLALCDLLPQSMPSLIYNLQTVILGRISNLKRIEISNKLGCSSPIPWTPEEIYDGYITCNFTGHEIYEAVLPINNIIRNLKSNLEFADKYMTPLNLDYNYIHRARAVECLERLISDYYALNKLRKKFIQVSQSIYWNDTIVEWLAVYVVPHLDPLYFKIKKIKKLLKQNDWKPRPLPVTLKNYPDFINKK